MNQRRWERITALAAMAAAVLMVAALATWGNHYYTDPLHKITNYYVVNQHRALLSQFLFLLLVLSVLTFGVGLRPIVYRAEGEPHVLSALFFAGTVAGPGVDDGLRVDQRRPGRRRRRGIGQ